MKYKIGTRASKLSLAQTNWVVSELKKTTDSEYDIMTITTRGDADSRVLFAIDQKGIFEKEIDKAVADKRVDFGVHSLKDIPSVLPPGLVLACIPKRETVNDVIISENGSDLDSIKPEGIVGTSSLRRAVQIMRKRPDLNVRPIRGNIETRIQKISDNYDAIVLAQAGITRLKLDVKYSKLSIDDFLPSPGQGALGIVARKDDTQTIQMLKKIEDSESRLEIEAERALSNYVESGCRFPVGSYARINDNNMTIKTAAFSVDGKKSITLAKTGPRNDPQTLGKLAGEELEKQGVQELALNWRQKVEEWNKK